MSHALTPDQRAQRARIAAHAMHAQGKTNVGPANEARDRALRAKARAELDPHGDLPDTEFERRYRHWRSAHFARLAYRSSVARSKNSGAA